MDRSECLAVVKEKVSLGQFRQGLEELEARIKEEARQEAARASRMQDIAIEKINELGKKLKESKRRGREEGRSQEKEERRAPKEERRAPTEQRKVQPQELYIESNETMFSLLIEEIEKLQERDGELQRQLEARNRKVVSLNNEVCAKLERLEAQIEDRYCWADAEAGAGNASPNWGSPSWGSPSCWATPGRWPSGRRRPRCTGGTGRADSSRACGSRGWRGDWRRCSGNWWGRWTWRTCCRWCARGASRWARPSRSCGSTSSRAWTAPVASSAARPRSTRRSVWECCSPGGTPASSTSASQSSPANSSTSCPRSYSLRTVPGPPAYGCTSPGSSCWNCTRWGVTGVSRVIKVRRVRRVRRVRGSRWWWGRRCRWWGGRACCGWRRTGSCGSSSGPTASSWSVCRNCDLVLSVIQWPRRNCDLVLPGQSP